MLQKTTHPEEKGFTFRTAKVVFFFIRGIVAGLMTLISKFINVI